MIPATVHFDPLVDAGSAFDTIDQPVFVRDAARPPARELGAQRLGLAETSERMAHDVIEKDIDFLEYRGVRALPVSEVLPAVAGKVDPHSLAATAG
jgi:hypothetical protein